MEWGICGLRNSNRNKNVISVKKIYVIFGSIFCMASVFFIIFDVSSCYTSIFFLCTAVGFLVCIRKIIIRFVDEIEQGFDDIIENGYMDEKKVLYRDDLFCRIQQKMWKMSSIQQQTKERIESERNIIEEMVSDIAHQVKTPMTNVKMYHEILFGKLKKDKECQDMLCIIQLQVNKLDFLLQSIIKISELETGIINLNREKCLLSLCITRALENTMLYAKMKSIRINVQDKMEIDVYCDIKWTAEAIFNIIDNAIKYSSINGEISISSEYVGIYTCIHIEDNGIGIEGENLSNIFQRFYREKNKGITDGVGLGLSLAQEIIMKQEGYITVKSEKCKGSRFSIFLPRSEEVASKYNEKM